MSDLVVHLHLAADTLDGVAYRNLLSLLERLGVKEPEPRHPDTCGATCEQCAVVRDVLYKRRDDAPARPWIPDVLGGEYSVGDAEPLPQTIRTPDPYDGQYTADDVALAEQTRRDIIAPELEQITKRIGDGASRGTLLSAKMSTNISEARRRDRERNRLDTAQLNRDDPL